MKRTGGGTQTDETIRHPHWRFSRFLGFGSPSRAPTLGRIRRRFLWCGNFAVPHSDCVDNGLGQMGSRSIRRAAAPDGFGWDGGTAVFCVDKRPVTLLPRSLLSRPSEFLGVDPGCLLVYVSAGSESHR